MKTLGFWFVSLFAVVVAAGIGSPVADPSPVAVRLKPIVATVPPSIKTPEVQQVENVTVTATVAGFRLKGDETVAAGKLVKLEPEGHDDAYALWNIGYPVEFEEFATENNKLFLAMPKSNVGITLTLIPKDFPNSPPFQIRTVLKAANGGGGDDNGDDDKKPDPPKPTPEKDVAAVVVVEQRDDLSESARNIRMSNVWRELATTKNVVKKATWYDVDNPEAADFKTAAEAVGLPAVLLFDEKGEFMQAYPLPKTPDELMDLIR